VRGAIHIGGLPEQMARKMLSGAYERLIEGGIDPALISIDARKEKDQNVVGFGGGVVLWAETEGGCVIGGSAVSRKGMKPEVVGSSAAEELLKALGEGGCVDKYLQDQIIIFLALAKGKSTVLTGPLTLHTK
jgi:RNA 3'-terminal phosphate cyclase (ATP)